MSGQGPGHSGSNRQGWALLIAGALVGLLLLVLAHALFGLALGGPATLLIILAMAAFGVGIGLLWRNGRTRWAWALLVCVPGFLVLLSFGAIVWFAATFSLNLDAF